MYVLPFKWRESLSPEMDLDMFSNVSFVFHILKRCRVSKINHDKGLGNWWQLYSPAVHGSWMNPVLQHKNRGLQVFFLHSGSPVFWPPFWCQRLKPLLLYLEYPAIVFLLGSIFNYNIMLSYYLNFKNIWVIWIGNIMVLGMEKPWNNPLSWKILEHGFQS